MIKRITDLERTTLALGLVAGLAGIIYLVQNFLMPEGMFSYWISTTIYIYFSLGMIILLFFVLMQATHFKYKEKGTVDFLVKFKVSKNLTESFFDKGIEVVTASPLLALYSTFNAYGIPIIKSKLPSFPGIEIVSFVFFILIMGAILRLPEMFKRKGGK